MENLLTFIRSVMADVPHTSSANGCTTNVNNPTSLNKNPQSRHSEGFLWVFAQDGGLEFGGLRWWAAQSGGPAWWDDTLLHQIMQRKSKRRSIWFYAD